MTESFCKDLLRRHFGRVASAAEEANVTRMGVYVAIRRHGLWPFALQMRAKGLRRGVR